MPALCSALCLFICERGMSSNKVFNDIFNVNIMNNSEKYLQNNYNKNWKNDLVKDKRYPHEGKILANKTCDFHFKKYPNLYKK